MDSIWDLLKSLGIGTGTTNGVDPSAGGAVTGAVAGTDPSVSPMPPTQNVATQPIQNPASSVTPVAPQAPQAPQGTPPTQPMTPQTAQQKYNSIGQNGMNLMKMGAPQTGGVAAPQVHVGQLPSLLQLLFPNRYQNQG